MSIADRVLGIFAGIGIAFTIFVALAAIVQAFQWLNECPCKRYK